MKKLEISLIIGMITAVIFAGFGSFADSYGRITDNVLRLHIKANSNSEADRELKYLVRDEILREAAAYFEGASSAEQAALKASEKLTEIESIARGVLSANGYDYDVAASVKDTYFPARTYGGITLPAGVYSALNVNIGGSEGENWWCIMFPPLCIPAVTRKDDISSDDDVLCVSFTAREIDMLKEPEKYEVRFYFAELFHKLTRRNK